MRESPAPETGTKPALSPAMLAITIVLVVVGLVASGFYAPPSSSLMG